MARKSPSKREALKYAATRDHSPTNASQCVCEAFFRGQLLFPSPASDLDLSALGDDRIQAVLTRLAADAAKGSECRCIFDTTASGAATRNALTARMMAAGVVG